jgi:surface antigen
MKLLPILLAPLAMFGFAVSGSAKTAIGVESNSADLGKVEPYLQCVPYARQISGIRIFGDAHTWWDQAEGHYARGQTPRVGAVMAFRPHGNMRLGHVATVSKLVDSRTILLRHANWSQIDGRRGQIEDNVRAIDVSPDNDWSEVRVWYAPIAGVGTTHWPVHGFIYNRNTGPVMAAAPRAEHYSNGDVIGDIIARRSRLATSR